MSQQESAAADAVPLLNSTNVACVALMRLAEMTPESTWEAVSYETRRMWLRTGSDPQAWGMRPWRSLPPSTQKRLRLSVAEIQLFLASVGADLLA